MNIYNPLCKYPKCTVLFPFLEIFLLPYIVLLLFSSQLGLTPSREDRPQIVNVTYSNPAPAVPVALTSLKEFACLAGGVVIRAKRRLLVRWKLESERYSLWELDHFLLQRALLRALGKKRQRVCLKSKCSFSMCNVNNFCKKYVTSVWIMSIGKNGGHTRWMMQFIFPMNRWHLHLLITNFALCLLCKTVGVSCKAFQFLTIHCFEIKSFYLLRYTHSFANSEESRMKGACCKAPSLKQQHRLQQQLFVHLSFLFIGSSLKKSLTSQKSTE